MQTTRETYAEEQARKRTEGANNLKHVLSAIAAPVAALGLSAAIVESDEKETRILITDPTRADFEAHILGREWNDKDRASLWFNGNRTISKQIPNYYSDGSPNTASTRYEFDHYLPDTAAQEIGLEKSDYRYRLSSLNVGFKATKNAKLIVRDVLPAIEKYIKVLDIVSPKIDAAIARDAATLKLQNEVSAVSEYKHQYHELGDRSFTINGFGRVSISYCGSIKIEKELTEAELRAFLHI